MTQVEAKREACGIVNALLESYRCVGQPWEDLMDQESFTDGELDDCNRMDRALCELQNEMHRRSAARGFAATPRARWPPSR